MGFAELVLSGQIILSSLSFDEPYTAKKVALSYDGTPRSVGAFYRAKRPNFAIGGYFRLSPDLWISADYNNGHRTQKFTENQYIVLGAIKSVALSKSQNLIIAGSHKFGGSAKHLPCRDELDRTYYCRDMTAFVDFKPEKYRFSEISVKWQLRF